MRVNHLLCIQSVQQSPVGRQPLPVALALDDDLVAGVGEPVEGAVAEDGVVEESEPLVDSPVGGDEEAGGTMPGDDQLVEVYGLLLGHPVETEVVEDEQIRVAIDRQGVRLGELHTVATTHGYEELERWSRGLGEIHAFGIEGTGSYGAGVARFLTSRGYTVVEVNRPDRSTRYRKGKSDPTDAEMAARAVLAGVADATPKSGEGEVEMIRMLKSAKDSAVKARTQAINQMKALVVTAPAELRETLDGLAAGALVTRCKSFRTGRLDGPLAAARYTLRSLARRYRQLSKEVLDLEAELDRLTRTAAPALVDGFGIGPDSAATLLIAAGSNPDRLHSEAAFASLCGVSPIPASSGKTNRHRLNRGGHRQANAALHRIVIVRLRHDERTQAYMRRRTTEGMSKAEVIRCLKRYVAREVFSTLRNSTLCTGPLVWGSCLLSLSRPLLSAPLGLGDSFERTVGVFHGSPNNLDNLVQKSLRGRVHDGAD